MQEVRSAGRNPFVPRHPAVESEVIEIKASRSRPDRGMVTVRSETRNQRDEIVQILVASWSCRAVRRSTRMAGSP